MQDAKSVAAQIGDQNITLEAGLLAQQAAGSCTIQIGDTVLFSAATCADKPREGIDFFPLQVEYREKFYAAGRFPGGFFKREARPSEGEILTSRFTDRPIRPLFPDNFFNEVQINNMLLSADGMNDSDVHTITVSSASLMLSEIPFRGPIAGVRVGRINGEFILNPTHEQRVESDLDLVYAGNQELPLMIEGSAGELAEADLVAAMRFAQEACTKLCELQLELRRELGLPEKVVEPYKPDTTLLEAARRLRGAQLSEALQIAGKLERQNKVQEIRTDLQQAMLEEAPEMTEEQFRATFDQLEIAIVRENVLEHGKRVDGRAFDELRSLQAQVGCLPRTHGSAIFSRGETQALGTVTLGTRSDKQMMDAITGGDKNKSFMLHYNFPPYCVGECGRLGGTGRREIGHGALAERSLYEVLPVDYPYTVRLVSDIMGSNGSSSMASICVGTLAMMDAGIPIKAPVAGISVGLFTGKEKACLVTDILGTEDHCGDMDFKVAGTREGITGFQVDLKIPGLNWDLVEGAFSMARDARMKILDFMESIIATPRETMSDYAPRIESVIIDPEKIGELIGPGGKNIRGITERSGAQIDIAEDGTVSVYASSSEAMEKALYEIKQITMDPEEGMIYEGHVTGVKDFGAFVEILPGRDGLVHISELADFRVGSVEDICKVGDAMKVMCIGIDDRGRVKLSRRAAMQEMDRQANSDNA